MFFCVDLDFEEGKRAYLFGSGKTLRRGYNLMRGPEVLGQGHIKHSWEDRKGFFEEALGEEGRSEVKRLLEEALEAERADWLRVGRYVREEGGDGTIATGITGATWGCS